MNNKSKIIISLSLLGLFIATIFGITYAYLGVMVKGNESPNPSLNLNTGYLSIKYEDGSESLNTTGKTIVGGATFTKTFTVENTGVDTAFYSISFKDVVNPFERTQDWTYELRDEDTLISSGIVPTSDEVMVSAKALQQNTVDKLTLVLTYAKTEENQIVDMNKTLELNIAVSQGISSFDMAMDGTLLYSIKKNDLTNPSNIIVISPDKYRLASAEDNYGTSYYYTGEVTKNYVNYSGMCFRIVRILGNGNIKLVLADENHECNSADYNSTVNSAFINNGQTSLYNPNASTEETLKIENSNIKNILNSWLSSKITDGSKLVNTEWCEDLTIAETAEDGSRYGAYKRLSNDKKPTYKCNSVEYQSNIGLLTADEVAFASNIGNSTYLLDNAKGNYWTMTPYSFTSSIANMWGVNETGTLTNLGSVSREDVYLRPAIVLNKDIKIEDGVGTRTNPYIIN